MQGKVEHDPFRHKRVSVIPLSGENWQPNSHPVRAAVQPQAGSQVRLVRVCLSGEPDRLAAGGQHSRQRLKRTCLKEWVHGAISVAYHLRALSTLPGLWFRLDHDHPAAYVEDEAGLLHMVLSLRRPGRTATGSCRGLPT